MNGLYVFTDDALAEQSEKVCPTKYHEIHEG